jgi:hypothetical protein
LATGQNFVELFLRAGNESEGERTLPFAFARKGRFEKLTVRSTRADGETLWWSISGEPILVRGEFPAFAGTARTSPASVARPRKAPTWRCMMR